MKLRNGHETLKLGSSKTGVGEWTPLWSFECPNSKKPTLTLSPSDPYKKWSYCPLCGDQIRKETK